MASIPGRDDGDRLTADLIRLGLRGSSGMLVHVAMRQLGLGRTGGPALFDAIREAAGPQATVMVPTHTANNSTTSRHFLEETAGLHGDDLRDYIDGLPGFDPATTESFEMGAFAEYVRLRSDAIRSHHPQTSFTAVGPSARAWTATHHLDSHLGEESPIRALYDADAHVLMIGVGFTQCTAFHLAEYRLDPPPPVRDYHCFVQDGTVRRELRFSEIHLEDRDFDQLGAAFARDPRVRRGRVGRAAALAFPVRPAVDFAVRWMAANRRAGVRTAVR
jgi:aminoglycoside 3-N-acetyltransferase